MRLADLKWRRQPDGFWDKAIVSGQEVIHIYRTVNGQRDCGGFGFRPGPYIVIVPPDFEGHDGLSAVEAQCLLFHHMGENHETAEGSELAEGERYLG
jgi:hypothetical protein